MIRYINGLAALLVVTVGALPAQCLHQRSGSRQSRARVQIAILGTIARQGFLCRTCIDTRPYCIGDFPECRRRYAGRRLIQRPHFVQSAPSRLRQRQ